MMITWMSKDAGVRRGVLSSLPLVPSLAGQLRLSGDSRSLRSRVCVGGVGWGGENSTEGA